jgi:hypothetical protein
MSQSMHPRLFLTPKPYDIGKFVVCMNYCNSLRTISGSNSRPFRAIIAPSVAMVDIPSINIVRVKDAIIAFASTQFHVVIEMVNGNAPAMVTMG